MGVPITGCQAMCLTSPPLAGGLQPGCKTSPLASFVLQESGLGSDPWLLQPMDPGMDNILKHLWGAMHLSTKIPYGIGSTELIIVGFHNLVGSPGLLSESSRNCEPRPEGEGIKHIDAHICGTNIGGYVCLVMVATMFVTLMFCPPQTM